MGSQSLADIKMTGCNFAQRGWAFCDGQLLAISSNSALYSLLGTTFGGDGRTTFALPDLRGRVAIHPGNGPGLSPYNLGQKGGVETVTLTVNQIPSHNHTVTPRAAAGPGSTITPDGAFPAETNEDNYSTDAPGTVMGSTTSSNAGGNLSHTNIQPFLGIYHVIALQGIFPSRS